jgi:hypothetical protein
MDRDCHGAIGTRMRNEWLGVSAAARWPEGGGARGPGWVGNRIERGGLGGRDAVGRPGGCPAGARKRAGVVWRQQETRGEPGLGGGSLENGAFPPPPPPPTPTECIHAGSRQILRSDPFLSSPGPSASPPPPLRPPPHPHLRLPGSCIRRCRRFNPCRTPWPDFERCRIRAARSARPGPYIGPGPVARPKTGVTVGPGAGRRLKCLGSHHPSPPIPPGLGTTVAGMSAPRPPRPPRPPRQDAAATVLLPFYK